MQDGYKLPNSPTNLVITLIVVIEKTTMDTSTCKRVISVLCFEFSFKRSYNSDNFLVLYCVDIGFVQQTCGLKI